jgi:hypothetical protein
MTVTDDSPREYLKIKYSAPTGACKCANCQLVPPERLQAWALKLEASHVPDAVFKALQEAERTVRAWHKAAREMCDVAIGGDCKAVEKRYFHAAMTLPFYGADPDPLPSERMLVNAQRQPEPGAHFDALALDLVNQIETMRTDWPAARRKAHAQVLIIEALRSAAFPSTRTPVISRESPAPDPCGSLSIGQLIEWLDSPQYTNGFLDFEAANHMSAAAELLDKLFPETPSFPSTERNQFADSTGSEPGTHGASKEAGAVTDRVSVAPASSNSPESSR